jgi:hypothetical protein
VQPFNLVTPDNETLYAWHILPPHLCHENEEALSANLPSGPAADVSKTVAFELLAQDPNARVVVNRISAPVPLILCASAVSS